MSNILIYIYIIALLCLIYGAIFIAYGNSPSVAQSPTQAAVSNGTSLFAAELYQVQLLNHNYFNHYFKRLLSIIIYLTETS